MCKDRNRNYRISPDTHLIGEPFYYEHVTLVGYFAIQGYECTAVTRSHLSLRRLSILQDPADLLESRGWKIHISLADNLDNIRKAWNCLVSIFIEEEIGLVKLIRPEGNPLDREIHPNERGRQLTIYAQLNPFPIEKWWRILQRINDTLIANDIEPACHSAVCRRIHGSSYLSYRHDGTNENYIAIRGADSYNPLNVADVYDRIRIIEPSCKCCCALM